MHEHVVIVQLAVQPVSKSAETAELTFAYFTMLRSSRCALPVVLVAAPAISIPVSPIVAW